ncbi:MAG TPA: NUDIX hydrolase [Thermoanaerobaculia bacterium]|jgi:ADP-ribose pyrophosphatase|nr:NUDIX hydrolase [Thermoanaerobaculia bacterium]
MNDDAKKVFEGKHLLVLERDNWQFVERTKGKSAVVILAVTDDDRIVFVEQLRRPVNARVIDFPAGLVGDEDEHDDPAETAKKELLEETGYACEDVERLTSGPTSPGITSELVTFYRARGLTERGEGGGVGGEDIAVHRIPRNAVADWLKRKNGEGVLIDVKVWAGLWWLS